MSSALRPHLLPPAGCPCQPCRMPASACKAPTLHWSRPGAAAGGGGRQRLCPRERDPPGRHAQGPVRSPPPTSRRLVPLCFSQPPAAAWAAPHTMLRCMMPRSTGASQRLAAHSAHTVSGMDSQGMVSPHHTGSLPTAVRLMRSYDLRALAWCATAMPGWCWASTLAGGRTDVPRLATCCALLWTSSHRGAAWGWGRD